MNYQKHYSNLIESRKTRIKIPGAYYENHHIIMRCMGGTDEADNLVLLTAREHFLAHWLLWKIHRNRKTACAFLMMNRNSSGKRVSISSTAFEILREAASESQKGSKNPMSKDNFWSNRDKEAINLYQDKLSKKLSERENFKWSSLSVEERSDRAKQIWAKRRENGTHHRRKGIHYSEEAKKRLKEKRLQEKLKML